MKQVDTIILVEDIQKSAEFYTDIFGLEILIDWKTMIVFKNRLAIHQKDKLQPESIQPLFGNGIKNNGVVIYIETDDEDFDEFFDFVKSRGVKIIHGIIVLPWQRIFRIYDPDDNIIEVGEGTASSNGGSA